MTNRSDAVPSPGSTSRQAARLNSRSLCTFQDPGREKLSNQELQLIRYSEALLGADAWIGKAEDLLRAASALERDIEAFWRSVEDRRPLPGRFGDVHAPYFMLVAFAIENLCKAGLIHRERDRLASRRIQRLPNLLRTHDLRLLVSRLDLEVPVPVEDLLIRLTQCAVWSARYPVPMFPDALRGSHEFSDGRQRFTAYFAKEDVPALKKVVVALRARVDEVLQESG